MWYQFLPVELEYLAHVRVTLNTKSVVFGQWQGMGKGFCSTQAFRIQADGASAILKMRLPRSIT